MDGQTVLVIEHQHANHDAWFRAVESRDSRFDGWVIVGVTSTGIYCRPSCPTPVRPQRRNMRFFNTPASAQLAGFRACKRCLPDAAPGSPEWNRRDDLVGRAIRAIDDGLVDRAGVDGLASHLGVSSRHLTRVLSSELGATPIALARARRARAARVLIETTSLRFADVAFAAGFDSIRQFNDTIKEVLASSPSELRHRAATRRQPAQSDHAGAAVVPLRLAFRAPYRHDQVMGWLSAHAVPAIETAAGNRYARSMRLPGGPGVVELELLESHVEATFRLTSLSDLQTAVHRCRRMLDLDADPGVVEEVLRTDPFLAPVVAEHPGTRSPADADGSDAVLRAVIHQQVSVASAVGVLARLVAAHGEPVSDALGRPGGSSGQPAITTVFPGPEVWAELDPAELGLPLRRAHTVVAVARAVASGAIDLSPGADRSHTRAALLGIKGVGPWTAAIASLRGLSDPDVFVPGDLALRRAAEALGMPATPLELEGVSGRWQPWRSYAMHHLWQTYRPRSATPSSKRLSGRIEQSDRKQAS